MRALRILLAVLMVCAVASIASAEIMEAVVESVTVDTDKNGREYVRLIIPVTKDEQGISYDVTRPAMAFSKKNGEDTSLVDYAKTLQPGDKVKFACDKRVWEGRESYTIHKFITE